MACFECGLEQAVADAGICVRCGAPLTDEEHPSGTFTRGDGAEMRVDSRGITTVGRRRKARSRLLPWEEISWFRDGWHAPESGMPGWVLDVVLTGGRAAPVTETWTPGMSTAPPEVLSLVRRAAAVHSVPAVLTGGKIRQGLPGHDLVFRFRIAHTAGLYYDPAGEPGLREWTGTKWSPFIQVDPSASGHPGQETGLASIWSPLPAAELQRQSNALMRGVRTSTAISVVVGAGMVLFLILIAAHSTSHHVNGTEAGAGASALIFLAGCVFCLWQARTQKRIALAIRADASGLFAEIDPPAAPGVTPGTP